jgi:hypothetical protein
VAGWRPCGATGTCKPFVYGFLGDVNMSHAGAALAKADTESDLADRFLTSTDSPILACVDLTIFSPLASTLKGNPLRWSAGERPRIPILEE